jgi:hypothetical protein
MLMYKTCQRRQAENQFSTCLGGPYNKAFFFQILDISIVLSKNMKYLMFSKMNNCYMGLWFWVHLVEVNLTLLLFVLQLCTASVTDLSKILCLNKMYSLKKGKFLSRKIYCFRLFPKIAKILLA